jgi:hypothetical protein
MTPQLRTRLTNILALLVTGAAIIPAGAYLIGRYVIGPYAGQSGLASYLGSIYLAAWQGEKAALILILAPMLIVGIWLIGLRLFWRDQAGNDSTPV